MYAEREKGLDRAEKHQLQLLNIRLLIGIKSLFVLWKDKGLRFVVQRRWGLEMTAILSILNKVDGETFANERFPPPTSTDAIHNEEKTSNVQWYMRNRRNISYRMV